LKQIEESQWDEIAAPEPICELPMKVKQISKAHGLEFFSYEDEEAGTIKAAVVIIDDCKYWLFCPANQGEIGVCVNVRSFQANSRQALDKLLKQLNLQESQLPWVNEFLGPAQWVLTRLDDNDNEVEMNRFLNEESARFVRDDLEERDPKLDYYLRNVDSQQP
jgi:hypothetical protein